MSLTGGFPTFNAVRKLSMEIHTSTDVLSIRLSRVMLRSWEFNHDDDDDDDDKFQLS